MDDPRFDYEPMSDAEVVRVQQRIAMKWNVASALILSAIVVFCVIQVVPGWASATSLSEMSASDMVWFFLSMGYITFAGFGSLLWMLSAWVFNDGDESLTILDIVRLKELQQICDDVPAVSQYVSRWIADGVTLRRRDLQAVTNYVSRLKAVERHRQNEALRNEILQDLGQSRNAA